MKLERMGAQCVESRVNKEGSMVQRMKRVDEGFGRMEGSTDETPRNIHCLKLEV